MSSSSGDTTVALASPELVTVMTMVTGCEVEARTGAKLNEEARAAGDFTTIVPNWLVELMVLPEMASLPEAKTVKW